MQTLKKVFFNIILAAVLLLPMGASAQVLASSVNTYSPYSMYGMGELAVKGNTIQRALGGIGVAMWSNTMVNVMNPAAFGITPRQAFLFNFGVEGSHFRNEQTKFGETHRNVETAYNSINIHDIAFQMPLAKGLGLGFSLTPYSSVGYNMYSDDTSSDITGAVGNVRYNYLGDGDVTEVKAGIGWMPFSGFSVGVAAIYYWGNIERSYSASPQVITGSGEYSTTTGIDTYDVSRIKAQFGVMWNPIYQDQRILTIGATYDLGGALKPGLVKYVYVDNLLSSVVREETDKALPLRLPHQLSVGVFYQTMKFRLGADYVYQNWGSENSDYLESGGRGVHVAYTDTHTIKAGLEFVPRSSDVGNYLNRVAYRVGVRVGDYYQSFGGCSVAQYAVTAGLGLPIRLFGRSAINVGFEYGIRKPEHETISLGETETGMIKQQYVKFSLGFSLFGEDRWFVRHRYD